MLSILPQFNRGETMYKYLLALSAVAVATTTAQPAHAGAVALCIEKTKNSAGNDFDSEYFLRHGKSPNVNGFTALRAARQDHRKSYKSSTPYCRHNGRKLADGGYFVIIKDGRTKDFGDAHYNRWALGFGKTRAEALADAKKELWGRNSPLLEKKYGYKIEEEDKI